MVFPVLNNFVNSVPPYLKHVDFLQWIAVYDRVMPGVHTPAKLKASLKEKNSLHAEDIIVMI
jgi:hypothetical protein